MAETRAMVLRAGWHAGRVRVTTSSRGGQDLVAPFDARVVWQEPDEVQVVLVPTMAQLLDGDHLDVRVVVEPGLRLRIVEVSGMVTYPGTGAGASYRSSMKVGAGAAVVWLAQPFVLAARSSVLRETTVSLDAGATACLREILVLGRSGEPSGAARISTRIDDADGPLLVEDLELGRVHVLPGILGAAKVVDQVLLAGVRPQVPHPDTFMLAGPGALNRRLAASAHAAAADALAEDWAALAFDAVVGRFADQPRPDQLRDAAFASSPPVPTALSA